MAWTTPTYIEINMSAEIGAYQDDFEDRSSVPLEKIRTDQLQSQPNEA
jgi:coenzyme PQQ precursor peptide PqqA